MRKLNLVASLTLITSLTPVQAQQAHKPGEEVTVVGEQPERSKLVCERFVPTGSIKAEKICRTQAEFEQIRVDSLTQRARIDDRQQILRQMHNNCTIQEKC
jgi:hypothetical protein